MDDATLERIFEPFFTTKPIGKGTGMGLAMVHGIVKGLGGNSYVYSEVSQGTTFHLLFPRTFENAEMESRSDANLFERGSETLLYVDDEAEIVQMAQEMLGGLGYNVIGETSSTKALKRIQQNPQLFDLVITDQTMPDMTGYELARHIWYVLPKIPIILCTGFSEQVTDKSAEEMGISQYVMKPYSKQDIATKMRKALQPK